MNAAMLAHVLGVMPDMALERECPHTRYAILFDYVEGYVYDNHPDWHWSDVRAEANAIAKEAINHV